MIQPQQTDGGGLYEKAYPHIRPGAINIRDSYSPSPRKKTQKVEFT